MKCSWILEGKVTQTLFSTFKEVYKLIFKYWTDWVKQNFLSNSDELEGCFQTYRKLERLRKIVSKTTKSLLRGILQERNDGACISILIFFLFLIRNTSLLLVFFHFIYLLFHIIFIYWFIDLMIYFIFFYILIYWFDDLLYFSLSKKNWSNSHDFFSF